MNNFANMVTTSTRRFLRKKKENFVAQLRYFLRSIEIWPGRIDTRLVEAVVAFCSLALLYGTI